MWTLNIESQQWFKSAKSAIESRGFAVAVKGDAIICTWNNLINPHILKSREEFLLFASIYGSKIDPRDSRHEAAARANRPREQQKAQGSASGEQAFGGAKPASFVSGSDSYEELRATIERLRAARRTIIEQRDHWQKRALVAEAKFDELNATLADMLQTEGSESKFDTLRRFLAREFHPDHSRAEGIEKIVRSEVFKVIWPKIEEISKGKR